MREHGGAWNLGFDETEHCEGEGAGESGREREGECESTIFYMN